MNKDNVRDRLVELVAAEVESARAAYDRRLNASKPDDTDVSDVDGQAQAWTQADMAESFEKPLRAAEDKVSALASIDFAPKDVVEPGAIVTVDGRHFVIGVTMDHFTCDGAEFTGLSPLAPLYKAIEGLEASDTAEFHGRTVTIDDIA